MWGMVIPGGGGGGVLSSSSTPYMYPKFHDATQSALFRASASCPFLILAGALAGSVMQKLFKAEEIFLNSDCCYK